MQCGLFLRCNIGEKSPQHSPNQRVINLVRPQRLANIQHTFGTLLCRPQEPNEEVQSFCLFAAAAYCADKLFSRQDQEDAWTREIDLSMPMSDAWHGHTSVLEDALSFVSGDVWHIHPRKQQPNIWARSYWKDNFRADAVCLFSGGTDSLVGAIDLLEAGYRIHLVSHWDFSFIARRQKELAKRLIWHYGTDRVRHVSVQLQVPNPTEKSTRSRSVLFIGLGLAIAAAFGDDVPLYIPENGFVSMNVPLTHSRVGSYSTRTTHPFYFARLREALDLAGVRNGLDNPHYMKTKGEMLEHCRNFNLLRSLIPLTISCAHPVRWGSEFQGNCGYCYPCLVRRAGLHKVGQDRQEDYPEDAIGEAGILSAENRGGDLRAFLQGVAAYSGEGRVSTLSLLRSGSLADKAVEAPVLARMVGRGYEEVRSLIEAKGHPAVKTYAGL
jgi:7-cyano-7-deazaguanine synthase in queuosine biosynthesis